MIDSKFAWKPGDVQWVDENSTKEPAKPVSLDKLKKIRQGKDGKNNGGGDIHSTA
jgi:hypothetical protein